jgi:hypothetical protein
MQRRVAVLTTVMFLVGIDRQLIADVLRAFAAISPVTVRRVLDATGAWAAAEFVADVKALAAEIEQLEDLPSPGPSDPAPAWLDGPEPDNRAG